MIIKWYIELKSASNSIQIGGLFNMELNHSQYTLMVNMLCIHYTQTQWYNINNNTAFTDIGTTWKGTGWEELNEKQMIIYYWYYWKDKSYNI